MCGGIDDGSAYEERVQKIIDKDGEKAKKCLECEKIFYVGDICPFCFTILLHCEKCGQIKYNNKWIFPLEAVFEVIKASKEKTKAANTTKEWLQINNKAGEKIIYVNAICDVCKDDELCATAPIARCNER